MKYCREKIKILEENPELQLCDNGDFKINVDLVDNYEIIDMHCHLFAGLSQLFPSFLQISHLPSLLSSFIYLFSVVPGLHCCTQAFSSR